MAVNLKTEQSLQWSSVCTMYYSIFSFKNYYCSAVRLYCTNKLIFDDFIFRVGCFCLSFNKLER